MRLKIVHSELWLKPSAFHCGITTMACLGRAGSLCAGAGYQRALARSFSGYGVRSGEVKRRYCARSQLAFGRLALDLRVFGQCFRPDIGGEQFRIALLKPKIRRPLVTEKLLAVADQELVDAHHRGFGGSIVVLHLGAGHAASNPCASRNGTIHSKPHSSGRTTRFSSRVVSRVSHAYIQRPYQSVNMSIHQV